MAFDLQEQEQIAEFKAWWESWGKSIAVGVLIVFVGYFGWKGWNSYLETQSAKAGVMYASLETLAGGKDVAKVKASAELLKKNTPVRLMLPALPYCWLKPMRMPVMRLPQWFSCNGLLPMPKSLVYVMCPVCVWLPCNWMRRNLMKP